MIPTEQIINWLRESAMGKYGQDRIRMRETADRLEQLTIENMNLKSMVEQLDNSYQQLQEINDRTFQSNLAMGDDLKVMKAERDAVFEYLKNGHLGNGCTFCKHYFTESDKDPCKPCMAGRGKPNWEWRGANPWKD